MKQKNYNLFGVILTIFVLLINVTIAQPSSISVRSDASGTLLFPTSLSIPENLTVSSNILSDTITSTNITVIEGITADTITATGSVTADSMNVVGYGTNYVAFPFSRYLGTTNIFYQLDGYTGESVDDTHDLLATFPVPAFHTRHIELRSSASGPTNSATGLLLYSAHRRAGNAVEVVNDSQGSTNVWCSIDGTNILLYATSVPGETWSNVRARVDWELVANTAWTPAAFGLYNFEQSGNPDTDVWSVTAGTVDFDHEESDGTQSMAVLAESAAQHSGMSTQDDIYVAAMVTPGAGFTSGVALIDARTATTQIGSALIGTTGAYTLRALSVGGTGSGAASLTLSTNTPSAVMVRFNVGASSDTVTEVWGSSDVDAGWGISVDSVDGTTTGDLTRVWFRNAEANVQSNRFDNVLIDTSPIDIHRVWRSQ